jgi:tRNA dimethylallyltransferase
LHRWLGAVDPGSSSRVAPGDTQRILRALELALTGGTWSRRLAEHGTWAAGIERYPARKFGLDCERESLNCTLAARVERFFDAGLVDEVRALLLDGIPAEANAFKAIGYREVVAAIERGEDPSAVRDEVIRATRRYAKRQRTWFRGEPDVTWLDATRPADELAAEIAARWCEG